MMNLGRIKTLRMYILLALLFLTSNSALAQDLSSPPDKEIKAPDHGSAPTNQAPDASPSPQPQKDPSGKPKKEKRGELIIAPIPIKSPTLGSGLILGLGYVFKLNQNDKLSPPSTIGLAFAFTNSGSRAGGLGGRFYFAENKYQTTLIMAKGRANFDFYGIGRLPGRPGIKVPLKMGGTIFFGEFMRNVWKDIFVGPRYQRRSLYATLDGPQTPGGFEIPPIDIEAPSVAQGSPRATGQA